MSTGLTLSPPTFEQHHDGFGIGNPKPRISWRFSSEVIPKDWRQTAYEIEIQSRSAGRKDPETYHVQSDQSILVPWPSTPLKSREKATLRVRSFGKETDEPTEWSEWTNVEAGLLQDADWTAKLISASASAYSDGPLRPVRLRKTFSLPDENGKLASARLYITCFGVYEAYINGVRVGDDHMSPGWTSYHHRVNYQTFDVGPLLQKGANVLAVELAEGWYATRLLWQEGRRYTYGKDLSIISQLEVGFEGSSEVFTIDSDESWKRTESPILRSELYDGEVYDMREEHPNWNCLSESSEDKWTHVTVSEFPKKELLAKLVASDAPPVRVTEEVVPVEIFKSKTGKTLIDFGQNLVGKVHIGLLKKPKDHQIVFKHAEVLDNGELGTRPLRCAKATNTIICSGEYLKDWSVHFTFQGFRYVQVDGWTPEDESSPLTKENIKALVIHTDMKRTGQFSCSNELVNKLHENAVWSMRGNFLSLPTDCPQRDERLGWTGDIQVFGPSAAFLYDTAGMLGNWLEDLAVEQKDAKAVPPVVIPNVLISEWKDLPHAVWCDAAVLVPWTLYQTSGDIEILRRQYESMTTWLDVGLPRGSDRLWDPKHWQLGDWLDPNAPPDHPEQSITDNFLVANAYLVHVTSVLSKISELLGHDEDSKRYNSDAAELKATFQKKYMNSTGLITSDTQTAYALVLSFSLYENDEQITFAANRLSQLVRSANFKISCGFAGTPLITHALSSTFQPQLAYGMLLEKKCPSWLYAVTMGSTTMWERWDSMLPDGSINPGSMTSFNHYALGSVVNWLHECVAGISPLEPGWRKILVRPVPGGDLTSAEARYESPYGLIECAWVIKEGKLFELALIVPPNSSAWVILPDKQKRKVGEGVEEGFMVGSGRYSFSCEIELGEWPLAYLDG